MCVAANSRHNHDGVAGINTTAILGTAYLPTTYIPAHLPLPRSLPVASTTTCFSGTLDASVRPLGRYSHTLLTASATTVTSHPNRFGTTWYARGGLSSHVCRAREKLTRLLALAYPGQADSEHTYKFNVKVMIHVHSDAPGSRAGCEHRTEALTERTAARFPIAGAASHTPHTFTHR